MTAIAIPYDGGSTRIDLPVPEDRISVLSCGDPSPEKDLHTIIRDSLESPIGQDRLSEIASHGRRVAVMFDDFTRPTPVEKMMPLVLEELERGGVRKEDIVLVCANGMHDPAYMTEERLRRRVGNRIFSKYRVISHNAYDYDELTFLGVTRTLGTPLFINREVAEADLRISLGRIAPHGDMGYSGGAKIIMAGVSGIWSIIHNHSGSSPRRGVLHNPLRDDADECGEMAGLGFILNVVYNSRGEVLRAFAGDPVKARLSGIAYGDREVWGAERPEPADIVIISPGSGKDGWFIPSLGGLTLGAASLKPGGTLIVCASCRNGWSTPEYLESGWHVSKDLLELDFPMLQWLLASRSYHEPKLQFQALVYYVNHIVKTCLEHRVVVAGAVGFHPEDFRHIGLHLSERLETAVKEALGRCDVAPRVTVIPDNFILPLQSPREKARA